MIHSSLAIIYLSKLKVKNIKVFVSTLEGTMSYILIAPMADKRLKPNETKKLKQQDQILHLITSSPMIIFKPLMQTCGEFFL